MAGKIIERIHGKLHYYDIVKEEGGFLSSPSFWIYRDGDRWKGRYDSLAKAVEVAKEAG